MKCWELFEGRDAPLYHWMDEYKAKNVFAEDTLDSRTHHPIPGMGQVLGVSMSRNKLFTFGDMGVVQLTINQEKLAQNFEIIPVDGEVMFRRNSEEDPDPAITDRSNKDRPEWMFAEEFVVMCKFWPRNRKCRKITELHRYITNIFMNKYIEEVEAYADKWNISVEMSRGAQQSKGHSDMIKRVRERERAERVKRSAERLT